MSGPKCGQPYCASRHEWIHCASCRSDHCVNVECIARPVCEPRASSLNPGGELCTRCGQPAAGAAWIGGQRFCHGDEDHPSCFMREQWDRSGAAGPAPPLF